VVVTAEVVTVVTAVSVLSPKGWEAELFGEGNTGGHPPSQYLIRSDCVKLGR